MPSKLGIPCAIFNILGTYLRMKIRRKTNACLNCGHTLSDVYNFCPHCGQENNDNNVSFGTFIGDFFSNYFSFDSRIGRSLKPFFLRPGFLTNQFNEGKRMRYVHPLRLYLVASLVFFFLVSLNTNFSISEFTTGFTEGIVGEMIGIRLDSVENDSTERLKQIILNKSLTDQTVLDSLTQLEVDSLPDGWAEQRMFSQSRKLALFGPSPFIDTAVRNLPFTLLVAMPIFALLLKLIYIRRKGFYVQHLVHTLHLHSFSLLLFSLVFVLYLMPSSSAVEDYVEGTLLLLSLVYVLVSFRRVYQQPWLKTSVKVLLLGGIYFFILISIGVAEVLLSFFLA